MGQPIRYWPGQYVMLGNPRADIPLRAYSIANARARMANWCCKWPAPTTA